MSIFSFILRAMAGRRVRVVAPSYVERREGRALLIWGEVPYWVVVDGEMERFLVGLDGGRTVGEAIAEFGVDAGTRREVLQECGRLLEMGVLVEGGEGRRKEDRVERKNVGEREQRARREVRGGADPAERAEVAIESVAINVTRRCNLRCSFCYALPWLTKSGEGELSAGEFVAALDGIGARLSERAAVILLGGEPLLESDKVIAIARWARGWKKTATMSTNGTLITERFAEEAREAGLEVQVSLDGPNAEAHDRIRGGGVFEKALAGVRMLKSRGAYTILNMVVHGDTLGQLEAFYDLARDLGADEARFIPLKQIGGGAGKSARGVGLVEIVREVVGLVRRRPEVAKLMGRDAFSILANTCRYSARRRSCGTGAQTVLLDADGAIYPCLNLNGAGFRLGNVRDAGFDFGEVWRRSESVRRLRACTAVDSAGHECAGCAVRQWCLGGCRGETFLATGRLDARSPHCDDLRQAMVEMMWALAEMPAAVRPTAFVC